MEWCLSAGGKSGRRPKDIIGVSWGALWTSPMWESSDGKKKAIIRLLTKKTRRREERTKYSGKGQRDRTGAGGN